MYKLMPFVFFTRHARNSIQRHFHYTVYVYDCTMFTICLRCSRPNQFVQSIYLSVVHTCINTIWIICIHFHTSSTAFLFRSTICPFISQKYTIVFEIQSNEFSNCTMKYVNTFSAQISERKKQSLL